MYPFSRFRYRNYHDHSVYRYERVPAALVVQTEPEPSASESKDLLDTFNLNWLDEPDEYKVPTEQEQLIEDYSFGDSGLTNFLSMVNDSVNNPYDIAAIIDDICKDSANTSAGEDEEYTLLELKSYSKADPESEATNKNTNCYSEVTEVLSATNPSPSLPSPPSRSMVSCETKTAPAKPQKKNKRHKKPIESGFKFNIIRTTSSSSSSSSSEAPRSDCPSSTKDHIPKLSKCLAQIHSITAQASASSSSSSSHTNATVTAANVIKLEHQNTNAQIKTILEQQHHIRPIDLIRSLNSIDFIPETPSEPTKKVWRKATPRKPTPKKTLNECESKRKVEFVVEQPFFGFTKKDLCRPKRPLK